MKPGSLSGQPVKLGNMARAEDYRRRTMKRRWLRGPSLMKAGLNTMRWLRTTRA